MRVKLLIALAIASILLLAAALPAGAVIGKTETSSTAVNVGSPLQVPVVGPAAVVPCISFPAQSAPLAEQCLANTITLGGPALETQIELSPPQTPTFAPPAFVLPLLFPPEITPFECEPAMFDP